VAYICITLAEAEFLSGNNERALELTHRARAAYGQLHNYRSSACAANYLAAYSFASERLADTRTHARDALALLRTDRHPMFLAEAIGHLAHFATVSGDVQRGSLLNGYAEAAYSKLAHPRGRSAQWCYERHVRLLTERLGREELAQRAAQGARLSEDEALQEAFAHAWMRRRAIHCTVAIASSTASAARTPNNGAVVSFPGSTLW
jgi:hypothetical protein